MLFYLRIGNGTGTFNLAGKQGRSSRGRPSRRRRGDGDGAGTEEAALLADGKSAQARRGGSRRQRGHRTRPTGERFDGDGDGNGEETLAELTSLVWNSGWAAR